MSTYYHPGKRPAGRPRKTPIVGLDFSRAYRDLTDTDDRLAHLVGAAIITTSTGASR